jgi:hypothetical protein
MLGGITYKSLHSNASYFFAQLLELGRITLYERKGIPSNLEELYFVKIPEMDDYLKSATESPLFF